ncbi:MAG: DUF1565 domain-containing protein [bacterium]|nr:DUF1565 domain-containing protein [bacterium]
MCYARNKPRVAAAILTAIVLGTGCTNDDPARVLAPDTVDRKGGVVELGDGAVSVEVPAGAVAKPTTLTLEEVPGTVDELGSPAFVLGPAGTTFTVPVTVRIAVDPGDLTDLARAEDLIVGVLADGVWQGVPGSTYDGALVAVTVRTAGFGEQEASGLDKNGILIGVGGGGGNQEPARWCETGIYLLGGERFGALLPHYVDADLGSDGNPGTLALPWRTVTHGAASVPTGGKVMVFGPGPYEAGESFPIELGQNVVLQGDGSPELHAPAAGALAPMFRASVEPSYSFVGGFGLTADPIGGDRRLAIEVTDGSPVFDNIQSSDTYGVLFAGGEPGLRGCTLRGWAANVMITGGTGRVLRNTISGTLSNAGNIRYPIQVAGAEVACVQGNTISNASVGMYVFSATSATIVQNVFNSNDIGVDVGWAGVVNLVGNTFNGNPMGAMIGNEATPPAGSANVYDNIFRGHTVLGLGVAVTGDIRFTGNTWNGSATAEAWFGPSPWLPGVDVAWLTRAIGPARWWELTGPGPSARLGAAMGHDGNAGRSILFGGRSGAVNLDDTWEFDFTTNTWNGPLFPMSSPSARHDAAMTRGRPGGAPGRCLLFGGHTGGAPFDLTYDDLWVYDATAGEWSLLTPAGNPADGRLPLPRYGATFVARDADHFVLHGGRGGGGMPITDTWEYDAAANGWTDLSDTAEIPPARAYHAAIDKGPNSPGGMIVLGGQGSSGQVIYSPWNFGRFPADWWALLPAPGDPGPVTQANLEWLSHSTSPRVDRFLYFGGTDGQTFLNTARVYTWDWGNLDQTVSWSTLSAPAGTVWPPARGRYSSMSWPGPNGYRVLVFGGTAGAGQGTRGDTWIWMEGGNP